MTDPVNVGGDQQRLRLRQQAGAGAQGAANARRDPPVLVLRGLRGQAQAERDNMHVQWQNGIPENRGQRVSKKCCVFHKKRNFGESDSSSDDTDTDADSDGLNELPDAAVPGAAGAGAAGGPRGGDQQREEHGGQADAAADEHQHHHAHGDDCCHEKKRPKCTKEHCYCGTRFA